MHRRNINQGILEKQGLVLTGPEGYMSGPGPHSEVIGREKKRRQGRRRGRRRGREEGREGERERERRSEFLPLLRLGVGCLGFHGFTLYLQI